MKLSQVFVLACAIMELTCILSGTSLEDNPEGLALFVTSFLPLSMLIVFIELIPHLVRKTIKDPKTRLLVSSSCVFISIMLFSSTVGGRDITDSATMTAIYVVCIVAVFLIGKAVKWLIITRKNPQIGENNDSNE